MSLRFTTHNTAGICYHTDKTAYNKQYRTLFNKLTYHLRCTLNDYYEKNTFTCILLCTEIKYMTIATKKRAKQKHNRLRQNGYF